MHARLAAIESEVLLTLLSMQAILAVRLVLEEMLLDSMVLHPMQARLWHCMATHVTAFCRGQVGERVCSWRMAHFSLCLGRGAHALLRACINTDADMGCSLACATFDAIPVHPHDEGRFS